MTERGCPSCIYWKPTEMEAVTSHPHQERMIQTKTEMLRATHALCTWTTNSARGPDIMRFSPPWLSKRVGGGTLTSEDDGKDCTVWSDGY
jgi:hypothetical protein